MLYYLYILLTVICFHTSCLNASHLTNNAPLNTFPANAKDISPLLQKYIKEYNVPGMVAAMLTDKGLIAIGAAGVRATGHPEKVTIFDQFHIGSDTKAMTATLIAMLVEQKKLKWDTKVTDIFPQLKGKINPAYNNLTLSELLTMRGGVPANLKYNKWEKKANHDLVIARQMIMEKALTKTPETKPGNFLYSNLGYVIAGHMAETVAKKSWENLMTDMIFKPLNMQSAGFGPPGTPGKYDQPVGHQDGQPLAKDVYGDNPISMGPAGVVHLNILDWAKFIQMHLKGSRGEPQLITLESFKMLHRPISDSESSYAMGWGVVTPPWANSPVLTHAGSNTYWYAKAWIAPAKNIAVLVACNDASQSSQKACQQVGLALIKDQLHLPNINSLD